MKHALLLFSVLLALPAAPASASAGVPDLNIKAICKTRDADARLLRSTTGQTVDECLHDEEMARQQFDSLWTSTAAPIRNRCESDAHSLGTTSYLDLLACIQITDDLKGDLKPTSKKKASKE